MCSSDLNATSTPMMAITTSNSINVKPRGRHRREPPSDHRPASNNGMESGERTGAGIRGNSESNSGFNGSHPTPDLTLTQSGHQNDTIMSGTGKIQNQVRLHRAARQWSQQELAARAGISRTEVSAIETGRLLPSIATALALSHAFECRLEDLFQTQTEPPRTPDWAWPPETDHCRFWQAEIGQQTLLYPAETAFPWAPPHDGVSEFGTLRFRSQVPPEIGRAHV
mgnify:CR=1 FL=1